MFKSLVVLAILGAASVPAAAQTAPSAPPNEAQPAAKPQMVKKLVCEDSDNPYSRIGRVCHTVMVPAQPAGSAQNGGHAQAQAPQADTGN